MNLLVKSVFLEAFPAVRSVIGNQFSKRLPSSPKRAVAWTDTVVNYNVPDSSLHRGLMVVHTFQHLNPNAGNGDMERAVRVGWAMELLYSCFLVADDVMDGSATRRNKPCWFRQPNVGMQAVNDALLLENCAELLIKDSVASDVVQPLLDVVSEAKLNSLLGQHLDCAGAPMEACTLDHYRDVVRLKTSSYIFNLPICLGLVLADVRNVEHLPEVERLCSDIGFYFQAQDDYLDCFGDVSVTGKIGTDIQNGKCTWLLTTALSKVKKDGDQFRQIQENYGRPEDWRVSEVKSLYKTLGIAKRYTEFESEQMRHLQLRVDNFPLAPLRPFFRTLVAGLHQRQR